MTQPDGADGATATVAPTPPTASPWAERAERVLDEAGIPGAIVIIDLTRGGEVVSAERAGHVEHPATAARSLGSTVKPFVALAALHERVVTPDEMVDCDGTREIDGETFICFQSHGPLSLGTALSTSCNEYAYELATRLGLERIHRHLVAFGLADAGGVVPGQPLTAAHAAVAGVGHGEIAVSPIQLARAYTALATSVAPVGDNAAPMAQRLFEQLR